jgi:hypothetical protein
MCTGRSCAPMAAIAACLARTERTLSTRWRAISFLVRVRYEDQPTRERPALPAPAASTAARVGPWELPRPTTSKLWKTDDSAGLRAGRAFAPFPESRLRLRRRSRIQLPYQHTRHCWRWSCRMLTAANVPPRPQARPPPCDPTLPVWHAPSGWCRLTSFGSCGRLASHLERRHGPYHPMRVTTAHLGYAHAGRHRAGWAKGRTGMANPSGSRTPPRPAAPATCWSTTSKRSPPAWRARCHNGGCRPVDGRRRPLPACFRSGHLC